MRRWLPPPTASGAGGAGLHCCVADFGPSEENVVLTSSCTVKTTEAGFACPVTHGRLLQQFVTEGEEKVLSGDLLWQQGQRGKASV